MHSSSDQAAALFIQVVPKVMRLIAAEVRGAELGVEAIHVHLLGWLLEREMTLGELADSFAVGRPSMSRTISTLEARGWVTRQRDASDRRIVRVRVTEQGRDVVGQARRHLVVRLAEVLSSVEDERCDSLREGLGALAEAYDLKPVGEEG